jgi:hypothetical protein
MKGKSKGKRQKAKGKSVSVRLTVRFRRCFDRRHNCRLRTALAAATLLPFAFCLLPFDLLVPRP